MNENPSEGEEIIVRDEEAQHLIQSLPKVTWFGNALKLVKYQDFWFIAAPVSMFTRVLAFQRHYQARDTDIIITSHPKTGTTWLKSLLFAIVNRAKNHSNLSPLLTNHPHELVYSLDSGIYANAVDYPRPHHLDELPSPRLFSTHLSYTSLPESIKASSRCRIVYICRNPLDMCVSQWHFYLKAVRKSKGDEDFQPLPLEDYFEDFIEGRIGAGPFFEHLLCYWKESLEQPNKVLFLKYEDLKDDTCVQVKKLAEFVGLPFTSQEESQGVIEELIKLCDINNLKELAANKTGVMNKFFDKKSYFRKGEVGDWINYFSPIQVERKKTLMEEKLCGTGLSLRLCLEQPDQDKEVVVDQKPLVA